MSGTGLADNQNSYVMSIYYGYKYGIDTTRDLAFGASCTCLDDL